jgi:antirestriction protein ArdC
LLKAQANRVSGQAYQGINQFITSVVAAAEGYQSPYRATFKKIRVLGGKLSDAKGKGVPIIFYKRLSTHNSDGDDQERFVIRHSFCPWPYRAAGFSLTAQRTGAALRLVQYRPFR